MNWRPDNWEEVKQSYTKPNDMEFHIGFEAGADAILEELKERGALMTPKQMELLAPDREYPYGWLV